MSESTRIPGRIDEEASSIDGSTTEVAAGLMLEQMGTDMASKMFSSVSGGAVTVAACRFCNVTRHSISHPPSPTAYKRGSEVESAPENGTRRAFSI
jgi:hypothetical protein